MTENRAGIIVDSSGSSAEQTEQFLKETKSEEEYFSVDVDGFRVWLTKSQDFSSKYVDWNFYADCFHLKMPQNAVIGDEYIVIAILKSIVLLKVNKEVDRNYISQWLSYSRHHLSGYYRIESVCRRLYIGLPDEIAYGMFLTDEDLFLWYSLNILGTFSKENIALFIKLLLMRYAQHNDILIDDWKEHTLSVITSKKHLAETVLQKGVFKMIEVFCAEVSLNQRLTRMLQKSENDNHHFNIQKYNADQLISLCNILKENNYLEFNTNDSDFIYYFSGIGEKPSKHLRWTKSNASLTVFIDIICKGELKIWGKTECIFGVKNLKQTFYNTIELSAKSYSKLENDFKSMIRSI